MPTKRISGSSNEEWTTPKPVEHPNASSSSVQSGFNDASIEYAAQSRKRQPSLKTPKSDKDNNDYDTWAKLDIPNLACYESPVFQSNAIDLSSHMSAMSLTPRNASPRHSQVRPPRSELQQSFDVIYDDHENKRLTEKIRYLEYNLQIEIAAKDLYKMKYENSKKLREQEHERVRNDKLENPTVMLKLLTGDFGDGLSYLMSQNPKTRNKMIKTKTQILFNLLIDEKGPLKEHGLVSAYIAVLHCIVVVCPLWPVVPYLQTASNCTIRARAPRLVCVEHVCYARGHT